MKTTDVEAGERGGGYSNDVWVTEGHGWRIFSEGNKPMMKSTMEWDEVNPGRLPPAGLTYEDWIICQVRVFKERRGGGDLRQGMQMQRRGNSEMATFVTAVAYNPVLIDFQCLLLSYAVCTCAVIFSSSYSLITI